MAILVRLIVEIQLQFHQKIDVFKDKILKSLVRATRYQLRERSVPFNASPLKLVVQKELANYGAILAILHAMIVSQEKF